MQLGPGHASTAAGAVVSAPLVVDMVTLEQAFVEYRRLASTVTGMLDGYRAKRGDAAGPSGATVTSATVA